MGCSVELLNYYESRWIKFFKPERNVITIQNRNNESDAYGRKPIHNFYGLKTGKKVLLTGQAAKYPHQYIYQYNQSNPDKELKVVSLGSDYYAERVR